MTNRTLTFIVKDQSPLVCPAVATVEHACQAMCKRVAGSTLVIDDQQHLAGIFTGRDAVRLLAQSKDAGRTLLAEAMTTNPVTITPKSHAIDALRAMSEGNFRHVPVIEDGRISGVVSLGDFKGMEIEEFLWPHIRNTTGSEGNRVLAQIVHDQKPLMRGEDETAQQACQLMSESNAGSVLVIDKQKRLSGIFTGRDAVRILAEIKDAATTRLADAMTRNPTMVSGKAVAIDALHLMNDGGFRHLPVVEDGNILGVVSRSDFTGIEIDRLDEEEHLRECLW